MSSEVRIYKGHYTSGTAKWTFEDNRLYSGHYASGTAEFMRDTMPAVLLLRVLTSLIVCLFTCWLS